MIDYGYYLRNALDYRGYTQRQMAAELKCTTTYVNLLCVGKRKPSFEIIEKVCDLLDMPPALFFADHIDSALEAPTYALLSAHQRALLAEVSSEFLRADPAVSAAQKDLRTNPSPAHIASSLTHPTPRRSSLPVKGQVAAGSPLFSDQAHDDGFVSVPTKYCDGRYFVVQAKGDSMEPEIHSGDSAVVLHNAVPSDGELAVVQIEGAFVGEYAIKQFFRRGAQVELRSYNEDYEPMFFDIKEIISAEKVVDIIHG